jgi:N-acyl-D-aspartate/D-glutamate deacylase
MLGAIHRDVAPRMFDMDWLHPRDEVNRVHKEMYGWEIDWSTMQGFFDFMERKGFSPNYVPMVGHGEARSVVMGPDYRREATRGEIRRIVELIDEAMREGCVGVTVGRDYDPGIWAGLNELLSCAKVAAKYDGIYASHSLRTGHRKARRPGEPGPLAMKGVLEAIEVGRKAKISVQISHLGSLFSVNPLDNKEVTESTIKATLKIVDDANKDGVKVAFDVIPHHLAGGISTNPNLAAKLMPWLKVAGSPEQLGRALRMPDFRDDIKQKILGGQYYELNPNITPGWAEIEVIEIHRDERFKGKTIAQVSQELKVDQLETLMLLIISDPSAKVVRKSGDDWTKLEFFKHPQCMIGIDTFAVDETHIGSGPCPQLPSENSFGGIPHFIQRAVRETNTLPIEEAVRRLTSLPASKFNIEDRGVLKPSYFADLTIFDPKTIADKGTGLEPRQYPVGVEYVFINGARVVDKGKHTGVTPGRILKRKNK